MIDSIHQLTTTIYTIIHCSPPVLWTKTTIKGFYPPVSCETCRCCVLVGVSFDRMMALWDAHPKREVELKAAASARVRLCVCPHFEITCVYQIRSCYIPILGTARLWFMLCGETTADRACHSKDLEPQFSLLQLTEVYPAKLIQALRVQISQVSSHGH